MIREDWAKGKIGCQAEAASVALTTTMGRIAALAPSIRFSRLLTRGS